MKNIHKDDCIEVGLMKLHVVVCLDVYIQQQ